MRVIVVGLMALLAGCGGGGGGGDAGGGGGTTDPRIDRLNMYAAQKLRVLGDPGAGVMGMTPVAPPAQGRAEFAGFATLRVEGAAPVVLSGDANVQVDFATPQITGTLGQFFGAPPGGMVADYSGEITLTADLIAPDLRLLYAGTVAGGGQTLAGSGVMTGAFLGDPLRALAAADLESRIVQNGQTRGGTLVIALETTGVVPP